MLRMLPLLFARTGMPTSENQPLVVDASAAIAIVRREPGRQVALDLLRRRRQAGRRLLAPTLFWLELLNVLGMRYRLRPDAILEAVAELEAAAIETIDLDRPMLLLALDTMGRWQLSAYDAAYLAVAESYDGELLTADRRLAAAAGARGRLLHGKAVRERPAPYPAPAWAGWPGAADYLKTLRMRAVTDG